MQMSNFNLCLQMQPICINYFTHTKDVHQYTQLAVVKIATYIE